MPRFAMYPGMDTATTLAIAPGSLTPTTTATLIATVSAAAIPTGTVTFYLDPTATPEQTNGNFETGNLSGWTLGGTQFQGAWSVGTSYSLRDIVTYGGAGWLASSSNTGVTPGTDPSSWVPVQQVGTAQVHAGTYSLLLGDPSGTEQNDDCFIYQTVTIPSSITSASLSFWYWPATSDSISFDWQECQIQDNTGTLLASVLKVCSNDQTWENVTFDLTPYAGQTIRIWFNAHGDAASDYTYMYLDDIVVTANVATTLASGVTLDGSGQATYSGTFALGSHSAEAIYTPDSPSFVGSSSSPLSFEVDSGGGGGGSSYDDGSTLSDTLSISSSAAKVTAGADSGSGISITETLSSSAKLTIPASTDSGGGGGSSDSSSVDVTTGIGATAGTPGAGSVLNASGSLPLTTSISAQDGKSLADAANASSSGDIEAVALVVPPRARVATNPPQGSTTLLTLTPINDVTYVDIVGLYAGLTRLPGEDSITFLKRLHRSVSTRKDHGYQGALNNISLDLGLSMQPVIHLTSTDPDAMVSCSVAGLSLVHGNTTHIIPLLQMDADDVWVWYRLSDIVNGVNALGSVFTATLLVPDNLALQLARQNNLTYDTTKNPPIVSSIWPYDLVGSDVALIGLADPEFPNVAAGSDGALAYQVREALQAIMQIDRSYWAK